MIFKKTKIALSVASAALVMAGALVAPQAVANSKAEKVAAAMDRKVEAMELQIQQMGNMMESMQAELTHVKTQSTNNNNDGRFMELENWMASVKNTPVEVRTKDHMVFFRGGYAKMDHSRTDLLSGGAVNTNIAQVGTLTNTGPTSDNGWYVGAGFDFSLSDNLWGFMDGTEVLAELQFEYKKFGTQVSTGQNGAGLSAQNPLCYYG